MKVYGEEIEVYIGMELTKLYEKNIRGNALDLLRKIDDLDLSVRGEITMVVGGQNISEEDFEKRADLGELNREINVLQAISYMSSMGKFTEKQLRNIMKNSFN